MVAASCEEQEGDEKEGGVTKKREQLLPDHFLGGINCHLATQWSRGRTCIALGEKSALGEKNELWVK